MSSKLWEFFLRDDVESFRRFLANANYTAGGQRIPGAGSSKRLIGTSPGATTPDRGASRASTTLSRIELNSRDQEGRTLLHHIASSPKPTAVDFALALLETPFIDIYAQDWESGWTALHRALYAGNATIAQALMVQDLRDATDISKLGNTNHPSGGSIKIKDREGYSPFDVYAATITSRDIKRIASDGLDPAGDHEDSDAASSASEGYEYDENRASLKPRTNLSADEIFTFGSNKNLNLGLGDQDDRQFPERITLKRPQHLLKRFYHEFQEGQAKANGHEYYPDLSNAADLPILIKNKPMKFQNVVMSKLHTAILTDDPESNLFMCGFGPGGRLGTGDESTRFSFVCVESGGLANRKVISVALGQDHTLAITETGEIFSWGSNKFGQLGYGLPRSNTRDDVPIQTTPRQIFNPFKKEVILGAAASSIHSVVFSNSGLYTFGKNEGQLGLVDSDARSLETQTTPRRVGASLFSSSIQMVSAIDQATAVLLQNHDVWVFSQYGYSKLSFPLDVSSRFIKDSFMATRYDAAVNRIVKIASGGNTVCALSSSGEVFTVQSNKTESPSTSASTTNPAKTRNSLSTPVRVWSVKKSHMAVRDVDVGQDGSIIICTASGSAWTKEKRGKSKQGASKDYKFARIPGLTRAVGVRSNAFGAYAIAQRDCDVTKEQVSIDPSALWNDLLPLSPFESLRTAADMARLGDLGDDRIDFGPVMTIKRAVMTASDIEFHFKSSHADAPSGTVWVTSTLSETRIPVHEFILTGRSPVLRMALHEFRQEYYFSIPDVLSIEYGHDGKTQIKLEGVDFLTVLNIVFFLYTDNILDVWHQIRISTQHAAKYRQIRTEVMRVATHLGLHTLERAARLMVEPAKSLKTDMSHAINDPSFFESGDVVVQLSGETVKVHSQVVCQRCPFFDALFHGRSGGRWLSSRRTNSGEVVHVDLKHIERPIFDFVLRYMYADTEEQLFNEVRTRDLDDFIDLILDVAFLANELMIDRLAQICQKMLGKFVNTRNVCHLLNSISLCSVTELKDAALEYICLNLEDVLANRFLENLDERLLCELDSICRDNQLACFPVSRGRNSEDYVFEKYPELVSVIEKDIRRRIDSMRLVTRLNRAEAQEGKSKTTTDKANASPSVQRKTSTPKEMLSMANSPTLKPKQSINDLMFQMDEETLSPGYSMKGKTPVRGIRPNDSNSDFPALGSSLTEAESFGGRSYLDDQMASPQDTILAESPSETRAKALQSKASLSPSATPWGSQAISTPKKDLKDIMAESSQKPVSNLTLCMSPRRESSSNITPQKISQKERKRIQQQQMQEMLAAEKQAKETPQNPWKLPTPGKTPVKLEPERKSSTTEDQSPNLAKASQKPSMTLRQTVAGTPPPSKARPAAAAPTQTQTQSRSTSANFPSLSGPSKSGPSNTAPFTSPNTSTPTQTPIQSVRHIPRPEPYQTAFHADSPSSLSLATILMQQQTEKDEIREAATAKHNLQDIQAEQEFQEWWDKESRRIQGLPDLDPPEPTTSTSTQENKSGRGGGGSNRGKSRKRGGGQNQGKDKDKGRNPGNEVSALTQQLSRHHIQNDKTQKIQSPNHSRRDNQPRTPSGNHVDTAGHGHSHNQNHTPRRGRGGGGRGRGKDRERNT